MENIAAGVGRYQLAMSRKSSNTHTHTYKHSYSITNVFINDFLYAK